ncbi:MAG TPA: hypothetical protein VFR03_10810 [Thermoanaerobaculia bacterium]|nr:hypothetical protein [Thermoanaerobaculia bacterium]
MSGAATVREVSQAWARAGAPPSSASVELTVDAGGIGVRFAAPRTRPAALERAAAADLEATAGLLPEPLRGRLGVEVGEVCSRLRGDGGETPLFSRAYRLASCRGVVSGLREGGESGAFAFPWTGTLDAGKIEPELPVILGPSAVLALVSYALEVTGGHISVESGAELPELTVRDTAGSPYPPQHHPFSGDGSPSPDRPLIVDGRWLNREEDAGDHVDPLFYLLTRPDRALRPLAAATHFNRRNLEVACGRTAAAPREAVLVDSWRVRVGPRSGAVPFHAELSYVGPDGARLAVPQLVALRVDPWRLLDGVEGASGPARPAVDEDPIEGDAYGEAPPLVTGATLADLAAGDRR